jgi:hypothetical protein
VLGGPEIGTRPVPLAVCPKKRAPRLRTQAASNTPGRVWSGNVRVQGIKGCSFEGDLIRERTQIATEAIRPGARQTRSGCPVGRPRRVTLELAKRAAHLRGAGLRWKEVAHRVGLSAETCRKAVGQVQHAAGGVDNSPPFEKHRSTPEGVPR